MKRMAVIAAFCLTCVTVPAATTDFKQSPSFGPGLSSEQRKQAIAALKADKRRREEEQRVQLAAHEAALNELDASLQERKKELQQRRDDRAQARHAYLASPQGKAAQKRERELLGSPFQQPNKTDEQMHAEALAEVADQAETEAAQKRANADKAAAALLTASASVEEAKQQSDNHSSAAPSNTINSARLYSGIGLMGAGSAGLIAMIYQLWALRAIESQLAGVHALSEQRKHALSTQRRRAVQRAWGAGLGGAAGVITGGLLARAA